MAINTVVCHTVSAVSCSSMEQDTIYHHTKAVTILPPLNYILILYVLHCCKILTKRHKQAGSQLCEVTMRKYQISYSLFGTAAQVLDWNNYNKIQNIRQFFGFIIEKQKQTFTLFSKLFKITKYTGTVKLTQPRLCITVLGLHTKWCILLVEGCYNYC